MTTNKSGLHPQGHAVLCEPFEPELKASLIEIPDTVRQGLAILENRMRVVEIGLAAWKDEEGPRARVGDVVMCVKHAGFVASGADGKMYRMVNGRDIFCRIDEEAFKKAKAEAA
jgi:hypothetical protein